MPGFDAIVDQESVVRRLTDIRHKGNIPHALLFTGLEGVGKETTAKTFAMACNCPEGNETVDGGSRDLPCGECRSCRRIKAGSHPDIVFVQPQKGVIKISQIRDLCHILAMKPYEARQRVVIINDAQSMNPEAGNALLKLLEEPPDGTILILIAPHARNLLPTIVSRCQHIGFKPISRQTLIRFLVDEYDVPPGEAQILSALANGSMTKARRLVETGWLLHRNWILDVLSRGTATQNGAGDLDLSLAVSERISQRKDAIDDVLDICMSWFRDVIIYPLAPEKIINRDLADRIQNGSRRLNPETALSRFEAVQTARDRIEANANLRLSLDVLMMRLTDALPGGVRTITTGDTER